jgi:hypothetical protein
MGCGAARSEEPQTRLCNCIFTLGMSRSLAHEVTFGAIAQRGDRRASVAILQQTRSSLATLRDLQKAIDKMAQAITRGHLKNHSIV